MPIRKENIVIEEFQLHHTGIKTRLETLRAGGGEDFNCTIQELKHLRDRGRFFYRKNFNCTIQELKRQNVVPNRGKLLYFNCTIQELKQGADFGTIILFQYFNCTIQELKHSPTKQVAKTDNAFQLHHTGIKTEDGQAYQAAAKQISIAPYRN